MTPRYPVAEPGDAKPTAHIDRLGLCVTGLDQAAARTLARLVAEGLAPDLVRTAATAGLGRLQIEVTASAADQARPDLLARRITSELSRVLAHGHGSGVAGEEHR
jgi:hypothetical protein